MAEVMNWDSVVPCGLYWLILQNSDGVDLMGRKVLVGEGITLEQLGWFLLGCNHLATALASVREKLEYRGFENISGVSTPVLIFRLKV